MREELSHVEGVGARLEAQPSGATRLVEERLEVLLIRARIWLIMALTRFD